MYFLGVVAILLFSAYRFIANFGVKDNNLKWGAIDNVFIFPIYCLLAIILIIWRVSPFIFRLKFKEAKAEFMRNWKL
jgi:Na+/proline symporter